MATPREEVICPIAKMCIRDREKRETVTDIRDIIFENIADFVVTSAVSNTCLLYTSSANRKKEPKKKSANRKKEPEKRSANRKKEPEKKSANRKKEPEKKPVNRKKEPEKKPVNRKKRCV